MTWQYPEVPISNAAASLLSSNKATEYIMASRRQSWQDAFRSVYYSLRKQSCATFYYVLPTVSLLCAQWGDLPQV